MSHRSNEEEYQPLSHEFSSDLAVVLASPWASKLLIFSVFCGGALCGHFAPQLVAGGGSGTQLTFVATDAIISGAKKEADLTCGLDLFRALTSGDHVSQRPGRKGKYQMPHNLRACSETFGPDRYKEITGQTEIEAQSEPLGPYAYLTYANDSEFGQNFADHVAEMDAMAHKLSDIGLFHRIVESGLTPAMAFDIDNTLVYTAYNDTDVLGEAPPLQAAVAFVKKWCLGHGFDGKVECYFMTARYCAAFKAAALKKWVLSNFDVTEEWLHTHVFITGGVGGCDPDCSVAYKDAARAALEQRDNVTWVMSIGDQFTDSMGSHSGLKVKLPNVWFDSSAVPNAFSQGRNTRMLYEHWPNSTDTCKPNCVIPPSEECLLAGLKEDKILKKTSLDYCLAQTADAAPNQIYGCTYNLLTDKTSCHGGSEYSN